jgi:hypothetical protein
MDDQSRDNHEQMPFYAPTISWLHHIHATCLVGGNIDASGSASWLGGGIKDGSDGSLLIQKDRPHRCFIVKVSFSLVTPFYIH